MSDIAPDQLRSLVERILRLKAEQDAIAADIREVYAEAKGNGYDKTALGALVSHLRRVEKDADKVAQDEDLFDLYLSTYENAPRVHACASAREGYEIRQSGGVVGPATGTAEAGEAGQPAAIPAIRATSPSNAGSQGVTVGGDESGTAAEASRESASELSARPPQEGQTEIVAGTIEPLPAATGRATPACRAEDAVCSSPSDRGTEGLTAKSGVTAGERPGTLSPEREARVAEHLTRRKGSLPPLDPAHPLYEIRFKARHGRDPEPAERAA